MSQNQAILNHLKAGNSLAPLDALRLFGCWALSSRISDLRKDGHNIQSVFEHGENGKTYARYFLVEAPARNGLAMETSMLEMEKQNA